MRNRPAGFTLIELVAVCAIVAAAIAVAAIRVDHLLPKYRLRGAGREMAALLRQAKTRAAATGREVFVEIDLSKGVYWILAAFPRLREDGREEDPPVYDYQRVFAKILPDGVEFVDVVLGAREKADRGVARLRMSPLGASSHAIVNLRNRDGAELAVKMNGFTGHVSFHEGRLDGDDLLEDEE